MKNIQGIFSFNNHWQGIMLSLAVVIIGVIISNIISNYVILETITIVIFLGMLINNTLPVPERFQSGISFCMNTLIKYAIIFLGFRLNVSIITTIGLKSFLLLAGFVPLVIIAGLFIGRICKVDSTTSLLISIGSAICGVAAIMALSPLTGAKKDHLAVSISVISFLGAVGVVIFSFAGSLGFFPLDPLAFGVWSGISLHGVSHAVAAAFSMGEVAGESGTIIKLTRVLMIIPLSVFLSHHFAKKENDLSASTSSKVSARKAAFPFYVIFFIAAMALHSLFPLPAPLVSFFSGLSQLLFLTAMAAMGLSIHFKSIIGPGIKGLKAGAALFVFTAVTSLVIIYLLY